jgi:hypothetical protein
MAYLSYQEVRRLAEALPVLERTLGDRERALGADHPDTLESRCTPPIDDLKQGRQALAKIHHIA